jgi:hypothetical protein
MAKVMAKRKLGIKVSVGLLKSHRVNYIIIASNVCFTAIEMLVLPTLNLAEPPVPAEVALPSSTMSTSLLSIVLLEW